MIILFIILCTATIYIGYQTNPNAQSLKDSNRIESLPKNKKIQKNTATIFNYYQYIN